MAIRIQNVRDVARATGLKIIVAGPAGSGKTRLCGSAPVGKTLIVSAEKGLLSIVDTGHDVVEVKTVKDIQEVYAFLTSPAGEKYTWVCLDSVTEIGEKTLRECKAKTKHGAAAYGEMKEVLDELICLFRDLPGRNVVFTAKQESVTDKEGNMIEIVPSMPGKRARENLPYLFDLVAVFVLVRGKYKLQTSTSGLYKCKDRSGKLDMYEEPTLRNLYEKIVGPPPTPEPPAAEEPSLEEEVTPDEDAQES